MPTPRDIGLLEPAPLLRELVAHGVDFVVIGGIAGTLRGSARVTYDLDVCYSADPENLKALGRALVSLDARLHGVEEDVPFVPDERTLRNVTVLTLDTRLGRLDVMSQPDGAPPYRTLRRNAARMDVGGFWVLVAALDDLIAMKRASGRDKDRIDIQEYEAIKRVERGDRPKDSFGRIVGDT